MAITQVITDLPTPPQSTDAANFITRSDAFVTALDAMQVELNTFASQANALESNVNAKEASASASATSAIAAANYKGNWSSATSYTLGDSVTYNGVVYRAIQSGSNQNPSTATTYWVALSVASSIENTPSGGISSTDVQGALNELDTEKAPKANPVFTGTVSLDTNATLVFEGSSADAYETTLTVVDPTADRTITFPDKSITVAGTQDPNVVTAWINFNGSTPAINSDYGIASLVRSSTGFFRITFDVAMTDTNYAVVFGDSGTTVPSTSAYVRKTEVVSKTTTYVDIVCFEYVGSLNDTVATNFNDVSVVILGGK